MINRPTTASISAHAALAGCTIAFMIMVFTMLTVSPSPAFAADGSTGPGGHNEIYVEYSGGLSYFGNELLTARNFLGSARRGRVNPDVGFHVGGAIGMRVHELIRTELQLGYRRASVGGLTLQGEPDKARGHYSLLTAMVNTYIDIDFDLGVIPYAGFGIGWGLIELDARNENRILGIDGDDAVFVWSVMLGGTIPLNDAIDISIGYRYIATTDPEFVSKVVDTGAPGGTIQSTRLDAEFDSHEGVVAVRYKF
jgi:opacity protein-like surface antigen